MCGAMSARMGYAMHARETRNVPYVMAKVSVRIAKAHVVNVEVLRFASYAKAPRAKR